MKRNEAVYTAIDIGSSKITTLMAHFNLDGNLEIIGVGTVDSSGIHKGIVKDEAKLSEDIRVSLDAARISSGVKPTPAFIGLTGGKLSSYNVTSATSRISQPDQRVSHAELSSIIHDTVPLIPDNTEDSLVQVISRGYTIDGVRTHQSPIGKKANELSVDSHVVLAKKATLETIMQCVQQGGASIHGMTLESIASSYSVLSADEKELGVVLVDIGGGTTDIAIFQEGSILHSSSIPVGGYHLTNDIAISCRTTIEAAEEAKVMFGNVGSSAMESEKINMPSRSGSDVLTIESSEIRELVRDRMSETLVLVMGKIRKAGLNRPPAAGIVFTGGTAKLPGLMELAEEIFHSPTRIGIPKYIAQMPEYISDPSYATSTGLLLWGVHSSGNNKSSTLKEEGRKSVVNIIRSNFTHIPFLKKLTASNEAK